ncbi:MAG TPA: translation initiation factor IF-2, partial [Patescibacteria group bacterium]|nr:translation initiation factor IF-2 [Patescibacteria group bacterium]
AEDWGGDTVCVQISAKQRLGIDELLEMILLVADMQDLKADPKLAASGTVLEARLDRSRGPVATVLVQNGTLRVGDAFIAGAVSGKVRAMLNDAGDKVQEAPPATPVEVLGLQGVPMAGDIFKVLTEEWRARQIGAYRQQKLREDTLQKSSRLTLDHLFQKIQEGVVKELSLIVKTDVQGSVEALTQILSDIASPKVKVRVIHASTGAITESDVLLAAATNSIIIGFNVRPEKKAAELAEKEEVDIRLHTVVYNVANEIKAAMAGMLEPTFREVALGRAEVRNTFKVPKFGIVAGCMVTEGRIVRNSDVRLLRDNVVIYTGKASSLRRFKEDVGEVKSGYECGIGLEKFSDIKPDDVIEAFKVEKVVNKELYA